jgi:lysine-N-methylase
VDRTTFDLYQVCEDPAMRPRLQEVVTINTSSTNDNSYARIGLTAAGCPFLDGGLCGIQNKLGESYLSIVCAKYPRVMNVVDDVLQRSLDLACPEAARVLLLDPNPLEFDEEDGPQHDQRLGDVPVLTTADPEARKPYAYFREIRAFAIDLLQYRAYPLWKRIVILGSFCDQLEQLVAAGQNAQAPAAIRWFRQAIQNNSLDGAIQHHNPKPVLQLGIMLELIVARLTVEFVSPRFLSCYQEFKTGIEWNADSDMEDIGKRYAVAYVQHLAPFLAVHGHMLEHYLVNIVHRTLFPLGPQKRAEGPHLDHKADSIRDQWLLMMVYYGIIQTVLTGVAAFHRAEFSTAHAIRVIQSVTKAFEHSLGFSEQALKILADKGVRNCAGMAILLRNADSLY